ncbi:MAG: ATP-grasp domain-containing protein [Sporichthyaceae bacterium]
MRIAVLLARHPGGKPSPIFDEMLALLRRGGHEVDAVYPDEDVFPLEELAPRHDRYVLKCRSEMGLSLAAALHAQGARIVNSYPTSALCRDKVATTRVLQAAGIPVPQTWATACRPALEPLLAGGPLIVKPLAGSKGRGVVVVEDSAGLAGLTDDGPAVVQRFHPPDGLDRKLYCIGGQVFGVLRTWPARTPEEKFGRSFDVDAELRDIVLASGTALGIDLFGLDVVVSQGRPVVVDLSAFPGFKGVPDAAARLAEYVALAAD